MNLQPKILIVEDDPMFRTFYSLQVARLAPGAVVTLAHDGADALAELAAQPFDIILMDLHMPPPNGNAVLARLQHMQRSPAPIVIVISAFDELAAEVSRANYPSVHVFNKPLFAQDLEKMLMQCLRALRAPSVSNPAPGTSNASLP